MIMLMTMRIPFFFNRVVEMNTKKGTIEIRNPKVSKSDPLKKFTFDTVYDWK